MKVLIVEDNPLNLELARDLLEAGGHEVEAVRDGRSLRARLAAAAPAPSVVLMDILLPDADGVKLLDELRRSPGFDSVPVIAVTAQALTGDSERFLGAGFDAVMTKPIDTRRFVNLIERVTRRREV